jgi:hypothetical protein
MTARRRREDMIEKVENADITDPTLVNEPMPNADANEPMDPIDRIDPTLPMDRIEFFDAIERIEPSERIEAQPRRTVMTQVSPKPVAAGPTARSRTPWYLIQ